MKEENSFNLPTAWRGAPSSTATATPPCISVASPVYQRDALSPLSDQNLLPVQIGCVLPDA